jgi:DNA-binding GntR family transcriptional regulator
MLAMIESLWLQSGAYLRETREQLHNEDSADHLHESTVKALRAGNFAQARQYIQEDVSWIFDRLDLAD